MLPWAATDPGLVLTVRVTPKGGRDAIDGVARLADGQAVLKVRVKAAPADGEANAAVIKLIARVAGVAARDITISSGAASRIKRLEIRGNGPALADAFNKLEE